MEGPLQYILPVSFPYFLEIHATVLRRAIAVGAGLGDWEDAYSKARSLVTQMTNEEKANITSGYNYFQLGSLTGCVGLSFGVSRLNFPGICFSDAGNGLRGTDFVNAYPAGLHVGASWNTDLAYSRGLYMGKEFKAKGGKLMSTFHHSSCNELSSLHHQPTS